MATLKEPDANDTLWAVAVKVGKLLFALARGDVGLLVRGNVGRAGYTSAAAVTPSDTVDFTTTAKALYVGGAGDVTAVIGGAAVLFKAVPVGTVLPITCTRVNATGTNATLLVALS